MNREDSQVTRKTQLGLAAAGVLIGLGLAIVLWLTRGTDAPPDNSPPPAQTAPTAAATPDDGQADPAVISQIRAAYQKSLADSAPPGMVDLMQGTGEPGAGDLPPLPDPFVVPARYNPEPVSPGDLPPLPPDLAAKPELLPSPDESPAAGKAEKPADDLPPLPPPAKPRK
jgi:hypothetical protein